MKYPAKLICLTVAVIVLGSCAGHKQKNRGIQPQQEIGRKMIHFNSHWRFMKGDQPQASQMDFDDSSWEPVQLPHDWAIFGPFNPQEHGYSAKLPWKGVGWYRKTFTLPAEDSGKRVYLDFDGVMAFPEVYINGQLAGEWDYGYISFRIDATPYVRFGQENVVAVRADTRKQGTRWYPGAGIYRKVVLTISDPIHIGHWATFVSVPQIDQSQASVQIRTVVENHLQSGIPATVAFAITDPFHKPVVEEVRELNLPAEGTQEITQTFQISNPIRWDILAPNLYTLAITVRSAGRAVDTDTVAFGIRTFEFTANDGFHLNGRRVQIYGVNLHHDHGPLGAAFYTRAMERQLEIMKEIGVNFIRTSHNPPAPELLDLCDRMGLLVWDECFDKWDNTAGRVDGSPPLEEYGEKQIRNLVMRDRNHPCVVVWSIGNEIGNQPNPPEGKSGPRVAFLRDFVLRYDPTRPVGLADCIPQTANEPILDALDLVGWNYNRRYSIFRERYPHKPIVYSESASALSTRGFYELPLPTEKTDYSDVFQVDSYDLNAAAWSDIPDREFALMEKDRFVAGEMVWTGFDYLGEPTPFDQEAVSSYFGIVDLCGIPKDRFYLYRSYWRPQETTVHILPHWNWPDRVGKTVPVFVYTNGDQAELFLNGKSLGRRIKGQIPEKPANFALGKPVSASTFQEAEGHPASHAVDDNWQTRWCASSSEKNQWFRVDLEEEQSIRCIRIEFEREAKNYGYRIEVSSNGADWKTVVEKSTTWKPHYGGSLEAFWDIEVRARYVKVVFTDLQNNCWASIRSLDVYPQSVESDYYRSTYQYRLRWNDVVYEPGRLKAVAYKDGKPIGEAQVCTAGPPDRLRLTPDRTRLTASGEDLSYILVEAIDKQGNLCPLAEDLVHFEVQGPGQIAGVGNGNPMSQEPFQANYRKLFYGKAMLIVRSESGQSGRIRVTASADGMKKAVSTLVAR